MEYIGSMKAYTLDELEDKYIGKVGTPRRDAYEYKLKVDLLSIKLKASRKERNLTQEEFGKMAGVNKSQISKLEKSATSVSLDTIIKVVKALKADIHFDVKIEDDYFQLA